eukprot:3283792-Prorocentrum_lima.AAC.1
MAAQAGTDKLKAMHKNMVANAEVLFETYETGSGSLRGRRGEGPAASLHGAADSVRRGPQEGGC